MKFIFCIAAALSLPAIGQSTWNGLRFGMTEAELTARFKSSLSKTQLNDPDSQLPDKSTYSFGTVVAEIFGLNGTADLVLDKKTKRLSAVFLNLSPAKDATAGDRRIAYNQLSEEFPKKYGAPVKQSGCANAIGRAGQCNMIFRSGGQAVAVLMPFDQDGGLILALITYDPVKTASPI